MIDGAPCVQTHLSREFAAIALRRTSFVIVLVIEALTEFSSSAGWKRLPLCSRRCALYRFYQVRSVKVFPFQSQMTKSTCMLHIFTSVVNM